MCAMVNEIVYDGEIVWTVAAITAAQHIGLGAAFTRRIMDAADLDDTEKHPLRKRLKEALGLTHGRI